MEGLRARTDRTQPQSGAFDASDDADMSAEHARHPQDVWSPLRLFQWLSGGLTFLGRRDGWFVVLGTCHEISSQVS